MTLLCVPLVGRTVEEMEIDAAAAAAAGGDLVEIRLDFIEGFSPREDLPRLLRSCPLPALVTYRPNWEGGRYDGDDAARFETLRLAMELGVDYVDIELKVPIIGLVMSERGLMSRVLSPKFGGYLTFGILDATKTSASGQPTLEELLDIYNIRCIGPDTMVLGLIANPVKQSKSPILHNKCLQSVGYNAVYLPLLADNLARFLDTYSAPDFSGFSCSLPFKVDAVHCCHEHDAVAKSIGAINTIIRKSDGKLVGYNTDYIGAISAIEDGIGGPGSKDAAVSPLAGRLIVVVGAGGAGKAIAYGAKKKGARVVVANRTYEKAVTLANALGGQALRLADLENFGPEEGMILANATSLGMYPNVDGTPVPKKALSLYDVVFDAVYAPKDTRLLREAEECGVKVVSGVEMFIRQAMGQFEHFTGGIEAPESLMREIAAKYT
uniref:Uncharacterized protein n=2 Tax=Avena sativa TaxID=4498 RepID=A0ACD5VF43_AVESA